MKTWKQSLIGAILLLSVFLLPTLVKAADYDFTQTFAPDELQQTWSANESYSKGDTSLRSTAWGAGEGTMSLIITSALGGGPGLDGKKVAGAAPAMMAYIGKMYQTEPASTQTYVADVMHDMNIATPAMAQGLGFASLDPVLSVWKIFRNLAYLGFVIIFIIIGFMIMFRQKIGSQSVVTVQQALPNIVIALITVTFSYAIGGLLVDAMYVVMGLMVGLFSTQLNASNGFPFLSGSIFDLTKYLLSAGLGSIGEAVGEFVKSAIGNDALSSIVGAGIEGVASLAATLIFAIVILVQIFRLFFALLRVYVEIILSIAFAPIILMMGALPGNNAFQTWMKNLVGNLAVFPAILLFLIVFAVIKDATINPQPQSSTIVPQAYAQGFMPPYIAGGGGAAAHFLPFLVALGLLMGLAELPDAVKKAMGVSSTNLFSTIAEGGWKNFQKRSLTGASLASGGIGLVGGTAGGAIMGGIAAQGVLRRGGSSQEARRAFTSRVASGAAIGGLGGLAAPQVAVRGPRMVTGIANDIIGGFTQSAITDSVKEWRQRRAAEKTKREKEQGPIDTEIPV